MNGFFNRRHCASDAGSALVELAVSLPLLVLVMVCAVDFARVFYVGMELTNAARAGAQFGAHNPAQSGDIAGMTAAAVGSVNITGVVVTPPPLRTCQCATSAGTFSAATCSTTCPSGQHLVVTVTVTTSKTFTTVAGSFPGIPNTVSLVRAATLRVPN